jgi:putative PIN family toxin of toxin-antitoxin system
MSHEVVIDTNVLVAALRSRRGAAFQLIRNIGLGPFTANISVALALEYEAVLKRQDLVPGLSPDDVDTFLAFLFRSSNLVTSVRLLRPNLPDPGDELVLELAAQSQADIITYNKKDFLRARRFGVAVLSPAEFLHLLRTAE